MRDANDPFDHHETLAAQVGHVGKRLHQGQPCGANEVTPLVFGSHPGRQARHHGDNYPSQPPEAQRHVDEKGRGLIAPTIQVRVNVLLIGGIVPTAGGLSIVQAKAVNLVPCAYWNAVRLASDELRYPLD
ncbi:hypothetical protein AtubIFM57258_004253 [Aspergillus tubingensis]|nr:hypothetical protein AtubIFM57258_004253 [Aspergillus tubingensis]